MSEVTKPILLDETGQAIVSKLVDIKNAIQSESPAGEPVMITVITPPTKTEYSILDTFDPTGIVEIRELILSLNRTKEITFLISSHILSELSLVATKYGIISKGKLLTEITAEDLQQQCRASIAINVRQPEALRVLLAECLPIENCLATESGACIYGTIDLNEILKKIIDAGIEIVSINSFQASIETYYLSLIGGMQNA